MGVSGHLKLSVFKSVFKYYVFLRKEKCRNSFPPFIDSEYQVIILNI